MQHPRSGKSVSRHLIPALAACGIVAAIVFAGRVFAIHLEHSTISWSAPEAFPLKTQGLAFQRAAADAPEVLPIYGSSELIAPMPERGSYFFRTAPTGFQLSPVGKPGTTCLVMLQKIGALGSDLRGKKLVISLSSSWFTARGISPHWYEGNFSLLAASKLTFASSLDFHLKRDIASSMLQFPHTLAKSPLLEFALRRLASGGRLDQVVFCVLWPLGKVQNVILDLQDHFAALTYILHQAKILHQTGSASSHQPQKLDWSKLIAGTDGNKMGETPGLDPQVTAGRRDNWFLGNVSEAHEWANLDLLLRTLAQIHARPLLLSMPLDGQYFDDFGVSRSVREAYYEKIRTFANRYNFTLVDFKEYEADPDFLYHRGAQKEGAPSAHLAAKGWMFYNRVLDGFFHGRVPPI